MARETKVGLVVGMGFITCFAMILTNRGGVDHIPTQMPYQLFSSSPTPAHEPADSISEDYVPPNRPSDDTSRLAEMPAWESASASEPDDRTSKHRVQGTSRPPVMADPERFTRRRRPIPKLADPSVLSMADASAVIGEAADLVADAGPKPGTAKVPGPSPDLGNAAQPPMPPTDAQGLPASLTAYADQFEPVKPRGRQTEVSITLHSVEAGENLSKIARRYYRSSSKSIVDAIFEANRAELSSPDDLLVGTKLRLPVVEGITPSAGSSENSLSDALAEAEQPQHSAEPAYRLYRVAKGDQLGTIAQKQLGSSKRWREILNLNKDIVPDARRLPAGAEIRIPSNTVADAR